MFKNTALALLVALTLVPAAASAMSLPVLLPDVTYPDAPMTDLSTKGK
jgi:hypothetical protein